MIQEVLGSKNEIPKDTVPRADRKSLGSWDNSAESLSVADTFEISHDDFETIPVLKKGMKGWCLKNLCMVLLQRILIYNRCRRRVHSGEIFAFQSQRVLQLDFNRKLQAKATVP